MSHRVVTSLGLIAVVALADTTLEVIRGVIITSHEHSPSKSRRLETLQKGVEPTSTESGELLSTYSHDWTISFPDIQDLRTETDDRILVVKIWDPNHKHFPGWNSPCAEVFDGKKRLGFTELKEVGMLSDVWAASHQGHDYLYIQSRHRHRHADGIYAYELDHTTFAFRYMGLVFTKEALTQEHRETNQK
jgi:hypothetical protein